LPTPDQLRQFLVGTVVPPIAGALATWLTTHVHVLALFHIGSDSVALAVSQSLVFSVVTATSFLAGHHILTGSYRADTPAIPPVAGK
jgi:hypothetical protein